MITLTNMKMEAIANTAKKTLFFVFRFIFSRPLRSRRTHKKIVCLSNTCYLGCITTPSTRQPNLVEQSKVYYLASDPNEIVRFTPKYCQKMTL